MAKRYVQALKSKSHDGLSGCRVALRTRTHNLTVVHWDCTSESKFWTKVYLNWNFGFLKSSTVKDGSNGISGQSAAFLTFVLWTIVGWESENWLDRSSVKLRVRIRVRARSPDGTLVRVRRTLDWINYQKGLLMNLKIEKKYSKKCIFSWIDNIFQKLFNPSLSSCSWSWPNAATFAKSNDDHPNIT